MSSLQRHVLARLSRRAFLAYTAGLSATALAACGGAPQANPTSAPAAKATTAPVPTAAVVSQAPKPAAESKPAAGATTAPAAASTPATQAASTGDVAKGFLKAPEANPKRGGTVRFAFGVTTNHFDIHQGGGPAPVLTHTYNTLVRLNLVDGLRTIIPDLAETWEASPDGKTYVFKLRQGVKFHDGADFTADDVVASFNRIINPPEGVVSTLKPRMSALSKVEASDKSTVKMTLNQPQSYFLELLANTDMVIYSKKTLDENKGDLKKVIAPGTGAFKFKDHKVGERWTLEKNPNYWNKELPYVDQLEFIHVPAWTDRGTAVLSEQADLSWNVSLETFEEGEKRANEIGAKRLPSQGAYVIYINCAKKPFDDPRVRRAMHLALSRQNVFEAFKTQEPLNLTRWQSSGSEFAMPPAEVAKLPGYRPDKSADLEEARKLLAAAGFPDGIKGVDFLSASVAPHAEIMAPAVQASLKEIGIETNIRVAERAVLNDDQRAGKYDICVNTIGYPLYDPTSGWLNYFLSTSPSNLSKYSNPKMDELLKQADVEVDEAKRTQLIKEIEDMLDQEVPWLTVGFTDHLPMWRAYVKGLALDKRVRVEWGRTDTVWLDK